MRYNLSMKINRKSRGFTIMELLVVIAIIGILSTVVLIFIRSARDDARAVSAKSQLSQIRSQAQIFYNSHSRKYNTGLPIDNTGAGDVCVSEGPGNQSLLNSDVDGSVNELMLGIQHSLGPSLSNTLKCYVSADLYSFSATLNDEGDTFCVDSSGDPEVGSVATDTGCQPNP